MLHGAHGESSLNDSRSDSEEESTDAARSNACVRLEMPTQRPLTSSVRRISTAKAPSRLSNRSASLTSGQHRTSYSASTSKINQTINRPPKAITEKQIAARREREQQNLAKWQAADKYFRQVKARLDLYDHWDQRELRRTKSTGSHLNRFEDRAGLNVSPNRLNFSSIGHLNAFEELNMYWSTDQLVTGGNNQQLAEKIENQLCADLINELYIFDPRKIPYDIDVDLLRRPEAVEKLKAKVAKQENRLRSLQNSCLAAKHDLRSSERSRSSMMNHKRQLEQIYLEYSRDWLTDWQRRYSGLELRCCDEELLFPARKGQIKGKDRLRMRNNLVYEQYNRCRQLLQQVRRLSGFYSRVTASPPTGDDNNLKSSMKADCRQAGALKSIQWNPPNHGDNLQPTNLQRQPHNLEHNSRTDEARQSHLMQLLTDDERMTLVNVMRTTINMLDSYTSFIKRRACLYAALYEAVSSAYSDSLLEALHWQISTPSGSGRVYMISILEEAKPVWKNETDDLRERVKICITLMSKIYQLYATIYSEKIEFLDKQIEKQKLELEDRIRAYEDALDEMKRNPAKQLLVSLIDRSYLTFTKEHS